MSEEEMSEGEKDPKPIFYENIASIADALWEISHELTEIRKAIETPESEKENVLRTKRQKRWGI